MAAADSLDVLIRVHSDVAGAQQAKRAIDEVNNVIRASPADIAKATAATEELGESQKGLHAITRALRRSFPELGEAMHAGLVGSGAIAAGLILLETYQKIQEHIKLIDDQIKTLSDNGVERLHRIASVQREIQDETRKTAEADRKWQEDLTRHLDEVPQKLEGIVARVKALATAGDAVRKTMEEVNEAGIERQVALGNLTPEAGIVATVQGKIKAAKDDQASKEAAKAEELKHTTFAEGVEERAAGMAKAKLDRLTATEQSPEFQRSKLAQSERKTRIDDTEKTLAGIEKVIGQMDGNVEFTKENVDAWNSMLPAGHKIEGGATGYNKFVIQRNLEKERDRLKSAQDVDLGKYTQAQVGFDRFDREKAQATTELEAHQKQAEVLKEKLKVLNTEADVLRKERENLDARLKAINLKALGDLDKTAFGGVLGDVANAEGIALHQRDARFRGGDVKDAYTGQWRPRRPGEAPTVLSPDQQGELGGFTKQIDSLSTKDQGDLLHSMGIQRSGNKSAGTLIAEAFAKAQGNDQKTLALMESIIQWMQSHNVKLDQLAAQVKALQQVQ